MLRKIMTIVTHLLGRIWVMSENSEKQKHLAKGSENTQIGTESSQRKANRRQGFVRGGGFVCWGLKGGAARASSK